MVPLIAYSKSNICRSSKNKGALDSGNRRESNFFFESGISLLVIAPEDRKGLITSKLTFKSPVTEKRAILLLLKIFAKRVFLVHFT